MYLHPAGLRRISIVVTILVLFGLSGCVGKRISQPRPVNQSQQVSAAKKAAVEQGIHTREVLMPAIARVSQRIAAYKEKQKSWQDLNSRKGSLNLSPGQVDQLSVCRNQVTDMLRGYERLHEKLLSERSLNGSRRLITGTLLGIERKDIVYLEGGCPQMARLSGSAFSGAKSSTGMSPAEADMTTALAKGEFNRVIQAYEMIQLAPGEQPGLGMSHKYGIALMKNGQEQKARRFLKDLIPGARQQGNSQLVLELIQLQGDLYFASGNYSAARSQYRDFQREFNKLNILNNRTEQQLAALSAANSQPKEIRAYAELLRGDLRYNPQRDGFIIVQQAQAFAQRYPQSMVRTSAVELGRRADEQAQLWFSGLLQHADRLNTDNKPGEAIAFLNQVPADILPLDKQEVLQRKKGMLSGRSSFPSTVPDTPSGIIEEKIPSPDQTASGETTISSVRVISPETAVAETGNHVRVTALQETWDQGIVRMQAKEYDSAIAIFTVLINTSYGVKAGIHIEEAARLAADADRKKAAKLFLRADRTRDTDARKQLLLSSRALLEDILVKYPQAGLDDKIRRNLGRIDKELDSIERIIAPTAMNGAN